jgi:hypothetical protein
MLGTLNFWEFGFQEKAKAKGRGTRKSKANASATGGAETVAAVAAPAVSVDESLALVDAKTPTEDGAKTPPDYRPCKSSTRL